jgi:dCTP diphosphatase
VSSGDLDAGRERPRHDSIEYVTAQLARFRDEREWARFHTPKNLALSLAIEVGELLEHFQWIADDDVPAHVAEHGAEVAEELADVALYVMQLADVLGVSLADALRDKLALNAERYPAHAARGSSAKHTQLAAQRAGSSPSA